MKINRIIPNLYYIFSISSFLLKINKPSNLVINIYLLLRSKRNITIKLHKRWQFKVRDLYDILALKEVFQDETYKPLFLNLNNNTTLIDIGTYIGDVPIYAQQFKYIKKIIAIEPLPENLKLCKENIKNNKIKNIKFLNVALSYRKGKENFYIHSNRGQSGFHQYDKDLTKISVIATTLPEIFKLVQTKNIVMKCDCEGAEYDIFMNLPIKFLWKIKRIILEYHDKERLPGLVSYFKNAGYSIRWKNHPVEPNLGIAYAHKI